MSRFDESFVTKVERTIADKRDWRYSKDQKDSQDTQTSEIESTDLKEQYPNGFSSDVEGVQFNLAVSACPVSVKGNTDDLSTYTDPNYFEDLYFLSDLEVTVVEIQNERGFKIDEERVILSLESDKLEKIIEDIEILLGNAGIEPEEARLKAEKTVKNALIKAIEEFSSANADSGLILMGEDIGISQDQVIEFIERVNQISLKELAENHSIKRASREPVESELVEGNAQERPTEISFAAKTWLAFKNVIDTAREFGETIIADRLEDSANQITDKTSGYGAGQRYWRDREAQESGDRKIVKNTLLGVFKEYAESALDSLPYDKAKSFFVRQLADALDTGVTFNSALQRLVDRSLKTAEIQSGLRDPKLSSQEQTNPPDYELGHKALETFQCAAESIYSQIKIAVSNALENPLIRQAKAEFKKAFLNADEKTTKLLGYIREGSEGLRGERYIGNNGDGIYIEGSLNRIFNDYARFRINTSEPANMKGNFANLVSRDISENKTGKIDEALKILIDSELSKVEKELKLGKNKSLNDQDSIEIEPIERGRAAYHLTAARVYEKVSAALLNAKVKTVEQSGKVASVINEVKVEREFTATVASRKSTLPTSVRDSKWKNPTQTLFNVDGYLADETKAASIAPAADIVSKVETVELSLDKLLAETLSFLSKGTKEPRLLPPSVAAELMSHNETITDEIEARVLVAQALKIAARFEGVNPESQLTPERFERAHRLILSAIEFGDFPSSDLLSSKEKEMRRSKMITEIKDSIERRLDEEIQSSYDEVPESGWKPLSIPLKKDAA